MSTENPGVIFDASNSWNGYNHQGKLAILLAIRQILDLRCDYDSPNDEFKAALDDYFIEIEYLEDFSIGKMVNGKPEYYYVHQVKNYKTDKLSDYDSALLGLAIHIVEKPEIKNAYLHITNQIIFKKQSLFQRIKSLIKKPDYLLKTLKEIDECRIDTNKKESLYVPDRKKKKLFIEALKSSYFKEDDPKKDLNKSNIDSALNALEKRTNKQISDINSLSDSQINKIKLFSYSISGVDNDYCPVNKIEDLIKLEIKKSVALLDQKPLWETNNYVQNRYLFLLWKLDEHIIDRNLNYPLYKAGKLDRKIRLSTIYQWLVDISIETTDEYFYRYELKNVFAEFANEYCQDCGRKKCDNCMVTAAMNKLSKMKDSEMKEFLTLTCPGNTEGLSLKTISSYLTKRQIKDPFLRGLHEVNKTFVEDKHAITYIRNNSKQYILTTIELDTQKDEERVCTGIASNRALFELLRDYDYFISKNMKCESISGQNLRVGCSEAEDEEQKKKRNEHIAHLKAVKIITLSDFKNTIRKDNR